jgi:hypothetical protein
MSVVLRIRIVRWEVVAGARGVVGGAAASRSVSAMWMKERRE